MLDKGLPSPFYCLKLPERLNRGARTQLQNIRDRFPESTENLGLASNLAVCNNPQFDSFLLLQGTKHECKFPPASLQFDFNFLALTEAEKSERRDKVVKSVLKHGCDLNAQFASSTSVDWFQDSEKDLRLLQQCLEAGIDLDSVRPTSAAADALVSAAGGLVKKNKVKNKPKTTKVSSLDKKVNGRKKATAKSLPKKKNGARKIIAKKKN
jgi:hypothetical protein